MADSTIVGTKDLELKKLAIFPNPSFDKISFSNLPSNTEKLNCCIYTLDGKKYVSKIKNNSIDITFLKKGIYILEIRTNEDILLITKFIKATP